MKTRLFIASAALATIGWAVPASGAAHFARSIVSSSALSSGLAQPAQPPQPMPARFRVEKERGLLLRVWINQTGPYTFALDTGAGMNVISQRVVTAAHLPTKTVQNTLLGGLSSTTIASNREAVIDRLAVGDRNNNLSSGQTALVVSTLPPDIDGILDPTQAYAPYGYAIDMSNALVESLGRTGLESEPVANREGARVPWLRRAGDARPFVKLGDGRMALVDTGSAFGLAVNDRNAIIVGGNRENRPNDRTADIAGGMISSRRVMPTTISIGELMLRKIPTDIVFGAHEGAPLILGRDALYPFKISFDPKRRIIQFVTSQPKG